MLCKVQILDETEKITLASRVKDMLFKFGFRMSGLHKMLVTVNIYYAYFHRGLEIVIFRTG